MKKIKKLDSPVEKGIPLPKRTRKRPLKYQWDELEVGDSVLVPCVTEEQIISARQAAYQYGYRKNYVFETRITGEGLRVWRTK